MKRLADPLLWLVTLFLILLVGLPHSQTLFSSLFPELPRPVYQAIAVPVMGFGPEPAIIALILYGVLPILQATLAGLGGISSSVMDIASGMGMSQGQRLRKVELPLAAPVILAGIRTSVIINIGTATIASTVGANTLGTPIIIGLSGFNTLPCT